MKYGKSMNERIKLLAEQAKMFATPMKFHLGGQDYARVRDEKFAELIIRECMEWCDAHSTINGTAQQVRNSIKNHFGIEE
jgi:hypothetical protein